MSKRDNKAQVGATAANRIDLSGINDGKSPNQPATPSQPPQAGSGRNGGCTTWSQCENNSAERNGQPGTPGAPGVVPGRATDGDNGSNGTIYVRDLLAPIEAYSTGRRGGTGAQGGNGGQGGMGGNGGSGGRCCSNGSGGAGGKGGTGGKGGPGGNGGNGGTITVLYTNANGFNVTGSVSGGRKGPGGGPGSPGTGGAGGNNGGSGTANTGPVGDSGSQGVDGSDGTDGNIIFKVSPPVLTLTAITPNSGPAAGGTPFTLTGSNFLADNSGRPLTTVQFGSANAVDLVFVSDSQLTGKTPPGSGSATVLAGNPDGSFAVLPTTFTYT
ncbi:hypothetical protein F0U60_28725 [Archangium minus]|uniref:IPT/TIG domain-containing protein n=1 Tax=Archangium minus TaxID=83450 RepID=A0ABY9WWZ6_9BACT|nr:hypothetical protein F0U60_28725 [Archangium minus]